MPLLLHTTLMPVLINRFITFAWYGHLKTPAPGLVHRHPGQRENRQAVNTYGEFINGIVKSSRCGREGGYF